MKWLIVSANLAILILIAACANTQGPSGGPPDLTPPKVITSEPEKGALNFKNDKITLRFNKYMDKGSVIDNVYISPYAYLNYKWSGKRLTIEILSDLDTNTTYSLSLGTEYTDYFDKNKPEEAYNLIFSTGDRIDSGSISGLIIDEKPQGVYIFAYYLEGIDPDTLNPSHTKASYVTQVGTNGKFAINALKDGIYRVLAIRDQFKDAIYDEGIDGFGATLSDIQVKQDSVPQIKLRVRPPLDIVAPVLFEADPVAGNVITAIFSKNIDTFSVNKSSFALVDSLDGKAIEIASAYLVNNAPTKVEIVLSEVLDKSKTYRLTANSDKLSGLRDSTGNIIPDTSAIAFFRPDTGRREIQPYLLNVPIQDSATRVHPDRDFQFLFNTGINSNLLDNIRIVSFPDSTDKEVVIEKKADNYFLVKPNKRLGSDMWHSLEFSTKEIRSFTGTPAIDTLYKFRFKTLDTRDFGSASGVLIDSAACNGDYYISFISVLKKTAFTKKVTIDEKWSFDELPEGDYNIEVFCDANGNGKYDYGNVFPFEASEMFLQISEVINIKPRWNVQDIKIVLR